MTATKETEILEQEGAEVAEAVASPWAPEVLLWVRIGFCFLLSHLARVVGQPYEMHPDFSRAAGLTSAIIGAAIEVPAIRVLGLSNRSTSAALRLNWG